MDIKAIHIPTSPLANRIFFGCRFTLKSVIWKMRKLSIHSRVNIWNWIYMEIKTPSKNKVFHLLGC